MPRIFFIGDIVGRPGRDIITNHLSALREAYQVDLAVANGENAAGGSGITGSIAAQLLKAGVDGITLGDHCWDQKEWAAEIDHYEQVCRPANFPRAQPGRSSLVLDGPDGFRLGIVTVLGRQYMKVHTEDPFACADRMLAELETQGVAHVLVEIHAEATSEKVAMGWHLDGRAIGVIGTHTHIPTADLKVLPQGSAYQTDVGMTGPYRSVLGRDVNAVLGKFRDGMPRRFPVAEQDVKLCGCILDFDPEAGRVLAVEQVIYPLPAVVEDP